MDNQLDNIVIGTSCYENAKSGNLLSITGDGGHAWGYFDKAFKNLAPSLKMWMYYDKNPDNMSEEELIYWYIKEYINLRLKEIYMKNLLLCLKDKYNNNIVLLCHELPGIEINKEHFCHRRLLADYIELETGIIIPEISIDENGHITKEEIYDLKPIIKALMNK